MSKKPTIDTKAARLLQLHNHTDDKELIRNSLIADEGVIELNERQQKLLERWTEADRLMRSRRYKKNEVYTILMKTFNYSLATAKRDVRDMQYVFGGENNDDKSYIMALHRDFIYDLINYAKSLGELKIVVALIREMTIAIKEMPDNNKGNTTPAMIIMNFNTTVKNELAGGITEENAAEVLKRTIGKDFIEFEELK